MPTTKLMDKETMEDVHMEYFSAIIENAGYLQENELNWR